MKNIPLSGSINPERIQPRSEPIARPGKADKGGSNFKEQLISTIDGQDGLKFSSHASERMKSRDVQLTPEKAQRLLSAVDTARDKGARESLVLLDELAFVVSVKNRTVITACDMNGLKNGVFTKIDSAIVG